MNTPDRIKALLGELADLLGQPQQPVGTMSVHELIDAAGTSALGPFAHQVVAAHHDVLIDGGPDEQATSAAKALRAFHTRVPLLPVTNQEVDLAGFGVAPVHFVSLDAHRHIDRRYLLLSEVAAALGMALPRAHDWARQEHLEALEAQRDRDEERGDGRLGYDCLADLLDLGLMLCIDDPEARPDASGRRWAAASDWLISDDRIPALLLDSPWGPEFRSNVMPAMRRGIVNHFDDLINTPTVTPDGEPTGYTLRDALTQPDGLTDEEAFRRARRGPALDHPGDLNA